MHERSWVHRDVVSAAGGQRLEGPCEEESGRGGQGGRLKFRLAKDNPFKVAGICREITDLAVTLYMRFRAASSFGRLQNDDRKVDRCPLCLPIFRPGLSGSIIRRLTPGPKARAFRPDDRWPKPSPALSNAWCSQARPTILAWISLSH